MSEESKEVVEIKSVELPGALSVRDLAEVLDVSPIEVIKTLMANGVMANINQSIDFDAAAVVASEMGIEATLETVDKLEAEDAGEIPLWRRLIASEDKEDLVKRAPVVTILGHVDHGKTTLLDAIRQANVVTGEAGGITQHVGAYQAEHNGRTITFLDTPGHAAFTAMRARGAQGADVVILVVAADDGVMPQTKEALAHAKAAKVPIVVALNKIDKANANPELVKQQLADNGLVPDEWEGDTIVVPVSALKKQGLEDLLEAILLVADSNEIMANPTGQVIGTVIEAEKDPSRGVEAILLVQNGTLKVGDVLVVGTVNGRIRAMFDFSKQAVEEAGPSTPVTILGLKEVPEAGDLFRVVDSEKDARAIVADRKNKLKEAQKETAAPLTLESMFEAYQSGELRELRLIIKADVQGSLEPIVSSLEDLHATDKEGQIGVKILQAGTGNIGENDVSLAVASRAVVMGFNVASDEAARRMAERDGISIRLYDIIYRLTEDVEKALKGMLEPEERELVTGKAEVRAIFKASRIGKIAGCKVVEGEIRRKSFIRVIRKGKTIHTGELKSLKQEKNDAKVVREGFECGINLKDYNDIEEGDILEAFVKEFVTIE